jgi:hypothetical protein
MNLYDRLEKIELIMLKTEISAENEGFCNSLSDH